MDSASTFKNVSQNQVPMGRVDIHSDFEMKKMSLLRYWMIFIACCFIFEESALEIPSWGMIDSNTRFFIMVITVLIFVNIILILCSYKEKNCIYAVSLLFQIAFLGCDMKTSHHTTNTANYISVRNACSGRLILMALETSHLTSLVMKSSWSRFAMVNIVNIIMFSALVFANFDVKAAGFWEIGQLGSIYASAIVSLLIYHWMVEKIQLDD
jgi:hypothetical protein